MFKGDRVIVLHVPKLEMLDRIHEAHLGIDEIVSQYIIMQSMKYFHSAEHVHNFSERTRESR